MKPALTALIGVAGMLTACADYYPPPPPPPPAPVPGVDCTLLGPLGEKLIPTLDPCPTP